MAVEDMDVDEPEPGVSSDGAAAKTSTVSQIELVYKYKSEVECNVSSY